MGGVDLILPIIRIDYLPSVLDINIPSTHPLINNVRQAITYSADDLLELRNNIIFQEFGTSGNDMTDSSTDVYWFPVGLSGTNILIHGIETNSNDYMPSVQYLVMAVSSSISYILRIRSTI